MTSPNKGEIIKWDLKLLTQTNKHKITINVLYIDTRNPHYTQLNLSKLLPPPSQTLFKFNTHITETTKYGIYQIICSSQSS